MASKKEFGWAKLHGVSVRWPVQVLVPGKIVYCRADHAEFTPRDVIPFEGNVDYWINEGTTILRKKRQFNTEVLFLEDVNWVQQQVKNGCGAQARQSTEDETNHAQVRQSTEDETNHAQVRQSTEDETNHAQVRQSTEDETNHAQVRQSTEDETNHAQVRQSTEDETNHAQVRQSTEDETNHAQARQSTEDKTNHAQVRQSTEDKTNHAQARQSTEDKTNHAQARQSTEDETNHAQARQITEDETNHAQVRQITEDETNHAQVRQSTEDETNHAQARQSTEDKTNHAQVRQSTEDETNHAQVRQSTEDETNHAQARQSTEDETNHAQVRQSMEDETNHAQVRQSTEDETNHAQVRQSTEDETNHAQVRQSTEDETNHAQVRQSTEDETNHAQVRQSTEDETNHAQVRQSTEDETNHAQVWQSTEDETNHAQVRQSTEDETNHAQVRQSTEDETNHAQVRQSTEDETNHAQVRQSTEDETNHAQARQSTEDETNHAQARQSTEDETNHAQARQSTEDETNHAQARQSTEDKTNHAQVRQSTEDETNHAQVRQSTEDETNHAQVRQSTEDKTNHAQVRQSTEDKTNHAQARQSTEDEMDQSSPLRRSLKTLKRRQERYSVLESDSGSEYVPPSHSEEDETDSESNSSWRHKCASNKDRESDSSETHTCTSNKDKENASLRQYSYASSEDGESDGEEFCEVSDDCILRDKNVSNIFIRKIQKSSFDQRSGKKKKSNRVQNAVHACFYCGKIVQHIPIHTLAKHSQEDDVLEMINMDGDQRGKESRQDILRARGDHKHNLKVFNQQKGELILYRRPTGEFDHRMYGPCPECLEWLKLNSLPKHQKTCSGRKLKPKDSSTGKGSLIIQSKILSNRISAKASTLLRNEVFTIMRVDEKSYIAQQDPLIIAVGESYLRRNIANETKRKYYASQRMRDCSKLLMQVRERDASMKSLDMWGLLRPTHVDLVVEASLDMAMRTMDDEEDLKSPSTAIKMKYDLERMAHSKCIFAIKEYDRTKETKWKDAKEESEGFIAALRHDYGDKVTRLARKILQERRMNVQQQLPRPEDVEKMSRYIRDKLSQLDYQRTSWIDFQEVGCLALTRLLTYNKRRSGEIEAIHVKSYVQRVGTTEVDQTLLGQLSETEKFLMQSQDLIETRGKRGRKVPVLVPQDTQRALEYLANSDVRKAAGVHTTNKYLFPNQGQSTMRAYDAMGRTCQRASLETPERMTSVNLRKYMATLVQVLNLEDNEMDWVHRHLGHSKTVHMEHYRQMTPYLERVQVGKILLMQDLNVQKDNIGKNLKDISFGEILDATSAGDLLPQKRKADDEDSGEDLDDVDQGPEDEPPAGDKRKRRQKKRKLANKADPVLRCSWTHEEICELKKYFSVNFVTKVTPGRKDCQKAIGASKVNGGTLQRRHWHLIVKKMSALLTKLR
ncbi:uncharacterized protein LOC115924951 isoform X2 [Strongylocentrotus purpuratus]|uniref:Uncharacterized protein n=1 Tax=Strongylocentrotus purpuratus TaxID=7668 RepID=A0A7M7NZQ4_STRPU|nr:uncharacterized protein LOC115924951 isoform X2 [Strongylocentrotus purpuratus]